MFVANMYVDVWRPMGDRNYSEYSPGDSEMELIFPKMPIHITPFRPRYSTSSLGGGQSTQIIANTRRNYVLSPGDELRTVTGRVFTVDTVEETDGAFMGNSIIYQLTEHNPVV